MTMLPGRIAGLSCFSSAAWPSKGIVSTSKSAAAQAATFSLPEIFAPGALLFDFVGGILGALGVSRSDNDGLAGLRPAQSQAESFRASASENRDGPRCAHEMVVILLSKLRFQ